MSKMITLKRFTLLCRLSVLAAVVAWLPSVAQAQDNAKERVRVTLHKEAFFDIRVTENRQASKVAAEVAQFIKSHDNVVVNITGYADRQTGNPALNEGYANERAERFRKELIEHYDVNPNCLVVDSKGDSVQPFSANDQNRCVIIDGYGFVPTARGTVQRAQQVQPQRTLHDTVYVSRVDTLWIAAPAETLKEERPFGLNKANRSRNWFVTLAGGPAIFQGDHNVDAVYKDRIYPAFDLSVGKWIYPALGFRVGVNLDMVKSYYNASTKYKNELAPQYGEFVHGASPEAPYNTDKGVLYKMRYNAWNFHADVMFNFTSFIWRPYDRRIWNLIGYAGVGCIANWDNGDYDWFNYALSWNVGILNSFRVSEYFDINLDLRLKKFDDDFNCFRQGRGMDGITNLMIGGTWYFSKRGF